MKHTLISMEKAVDAINGLEREIDTEKEYELLGKAIDAVTNLKPMIPETECAPEARWIMHRDKGQGVTWWECSACNTLGAPGWKRCPVCEAKMKTESGGQKIMPEVFSEIKAYNKPAKTEKRKRKSILPVRRGDQIAWLVFHSLTMFLLGAVTWKFVGPML